MFEASLGLTNNNGDGIRVHEPRHVNKLEVATNLEPEDFGEMVQMMHKTSLDVFIDEPGTSPHAVNPYCNTQHPTSGRHDSTWMDAIEQSLQSSPTFSTYASSPAMASNLRFEPFLPPPETTDDPTHLQLQADEHQHQRKTSLDAMADIMLVGEDHLGFGLEDELNTNTSDQAPTISPMISPAQNKYGRSIFEAEYLEPDDHAASSKSMHPTSGSSCESDRQKRNRTVSMEKHGTQQYKSSRSCSQEVTKQAFQDSLALSADGLQRRSGAHTESPAFITAERIRHGEKQRRRQAQLQLQQAQEQLQHVNLERKQQAQQARQMHYQQEQLRQQEIDNRAAELCDKLDQQNFGGFVMPEPLPFDYNSAQQQQQQREDTAATANRQSFFGQLQEGEITFNVSPIHAPVELLQHHNINRSIDLETPVLSAVPQRTSSSNGTSSTSNADCVSSSIHAAPRPVSIDQGVAGSRVPPAPATAQHTEIVTTSTTSTTVAAATATVTATTPRPPANGVAATTTLSNAAAPTAGMDITGDMTASAMSTLPMPSASTTTMLTSSSSPVQFPNPAAVGLPCFPGILPNVAAAPAAAASATPAATKAGSDAVSPITAPSMMGAMSPMPPMPPMPGIGMNMNLAFPMMRMPPAFPMAFMYKGMANPFFKSTTTTGAGALVGTRGTQRHGGNSSKGVFGGYKCGRCGQLKAGHTCPNKPRQPTTPEEFVAAAKARLEEERRTEGSIVYGRSIGMQCDLAVTGNGGRNSNRFGPQLQQCAVAAPPAVEGSPTTVTAASVGMATIPAPSMPPSTSTPVML
jgi:hypothetical protein